MNIKLLISIHIFKELNINESSNEVRTIVYKCACQKKEGYLHISPNHTDATITCICYKITDRLSQPGSASLLLTAMHLYTHHIFFYQNEGFKQMTHVQWLPCLDIR